MMTVAGTSEELVILTHQYPHATGDASFVDAEIWSLAEEFDRIVIWTLSPSNVALVSVPSNVEFAGSLLSHSPSNKWFLAGAVMRHLPAYLRLVTQEIRARGRDVKLGRLLRSAAIAVSGGRRLGVWLRKRRETGVDPVVYSFWGTDCALALLSPEVPKSRAIVRLHRYDLYEEHVGYLPFRRELFARAEALLTVSDHGASYLASAYDGFGELPPIVVARLGTPDRGRGAGAPRNLARIVSCSSLTEVKRVHAIFDVANALAEEREVHWIHFGDGPLRPSLESRMKNKAGLLTVELRGAVDRSVILDYYAETPISAFLNLSASEGVPVSIMEAMSFGIPVVATDVGGTGELVDIQKRSGVLISSASETRAATDALRTVIDEPGAWDARAAWDEMCNAQKTGEAVASLLRRGVRPA